jgi:hypothetical protein
MGFVAHSEKAIVGLRRSFSAQVRPHGKPGQVGEPGAPVQGLRSCVVGVGSHTDSKAPLVQQLLCTG